MMKQLRSAMAAAMVSAGYSPIEAAVEDRGGHKNTVRMDNVGSPMGDQIVLAVGVED